MEKGQIIPNGVVLDTHEMATVVFLTELGKNVLNLTNRCVILLSRGQDQHWNVQDTALFFSENINALEAMVSYEA